MFSLNGITLLEYKNIKIRLDYSWFILFFLVVGVLGLTFFPEQYPDVPQFNTWLYSIFAAILFFSSILLHELGHAIVAQKRGMRITEIILFIFGGVAKMKDEPDKPRTEFEIAIGGPIVSALLATLFLLLAEVLQPVIDEGLHGVLWYVGYINLILLFFNMIPGFPLDGGRVARAAIWKYTGNLRKSTRIVSQIGQIFAFVLMFLGVLNIFGGAVVVGIFWIFIGLFLQQSAKSGYQLVALREGLSGVPVSELMTADPVSVEQNLTLSEVVDDYFFKNRHSSFPVIDEERLVGLVEINQIKNIKKGLWGHTRVSEIMTPLNGIKTINPDTDAFTLLTEMIDHQKGRLLVTKNDRLMGIVSRKDIIQFAEFKQELHH
ncbi:MAG: site-2 protease family protein [Balneolales bacterium]